MIFNMSTAGITSNTIYNQTKIVLSQPTNKVNVNKNSKVFIIKEKPSFSTSSSNKNINYNRHKSTKNE